MHAAFPNPERVRGALNHRGMAFASHSVAVQRRQIVSEGGYRTFPYAVGRYTTGPKEVYGRFPAMTVLPETKLVNEISKTVLRAGHKALDPPLLLQEDGAPSSFDLRPGALNFGGVNTKGNAVVLPRDLGSRVDIGDKMIERRQKAINGAFLVTLTQVLVTTPRMTAAERLRRAHEKAALLAPTMGCLQSEFLGWERVFTALGRPSTPDSYRLEDAGTAAKFHELGLNTRQADALFGWLGASRDRAAKTTAEEAASKRLAELGAVRSELGCRL